MDSDDRMDRVKARGLDVGSSIWSSHICCVLKGCDSSPPGKGSVSDRKRETKLINSRRIILMAGE